MKKALYLTLLASVLFACSNPMNKEFNKDEWLIDMQTIRKEGKADTTQIELLAGYIMSSAFQEIPLDGKTYGQLLEEAEAKEFEREAERERQRILEEEARAEKEAKMKQLRETVEVGLVDKGYREISYDQYLTYEFVFRNNSDKDIRGFNGTLVFNDIFGETIKRIRISYDEGIEARGKTNYSASTEYNRYMSEDSKLRNKDLEDIVMEWEPATIIFTDGTKLEQ